MAGLGGERSKDLKVKIYDGYEPSQHVFLGAK